MKRLKDFVERKFRYDVDIALFIACCTLVCLFIYGIITTVFPNSDIGGKSPLEGEYAVVQYLHDDNIFSNQEELIQGLEYLREKTNIQMIIIASSDKWSDGAAVRDLERPRAVRVPCVILAFDARIGQQRAFFAIQGIDPAQSGGGIFTGGCDGETARPHVAQQIAPAGRAGGIRHEQGFVIRNGGRRHVRVRRHRDEQAAGHGCIFIIGGRRERRCAVHRGESVFG